ncbi:MAG: ion transporter [Lachnospiraceae bacterium]|jgi:voltage-gated potassium channel|nr:ion transporter [Lachnospiraceae bacterium]MCI1727319.1 ion transporter [Lachnospiraceae bacterium]
MRKRLFEICEKAKRHDTTSRIYDWIIIAAALLSMLPLCFKTEPFWMSTLELYAVYILFADYLFHWITADYKRQCQDADLKTRTKAFLLYPFRPMVLLNFVSLLPTLGILGPAFLVLRLFRLTTLANYSKSLRYVGRVFVKEQKTLLAVLYIAITYIFISALIMFTFEQQSFDDYFEALYWATTALTTVGYGDVAPVTWVGRLISMLSSLFGIAVIALPAGIVTAGFVNEINADTAEQATDDAEDMANAEVQERIQNQNLEEMVKASGAEDTDSTKPAQEEVPAETAESRALAQADQKASQDIVQKTAELQAAAENAQNALFENIDGATIASAAAFEEEQALYEENAEESEVYDHE